MMAHDDKRIRGKVARILNAREVAFNIGANAGVGVGMRFDVLDPMGEDIRDPDTDEILGSLERPKIRLEVTHVAERLSIARTYKAKRVNRGGEGSFAIGGLGKLFAPPDWVTIPETLLSSESNWEDLEESESIVKTGDPVVQVIRPTTLVEKAELNEDSQASTAE
jgi:hypothetical protein